MADHTSDDQAFVTGWEDYCDGIAPESDDERYLVGYYQAEFIDSFEPLPSRDLREEGRAWAIELGYLPDYPRRVD